MAWRNLWRNYRRTGITLAAMTLALVVELLYAGLVIGLVNGMEEDATAYELGDVQILVDGYLTKPSLYDAVPDDDALIAKLEAEGYRATSRLFAGGLGASGELSSGVRFVGIDPVQDAKALDLHLAIAQGEWLDDASPKGVVVGAGLARTLALDLGDEVLVLGQASDGSLANELFVVRGTLMSVAAGLDRTGVLMTEGSFRELMVFPEGAHKVFVRRPPDVPLATATEVIRGIVGEPAAEGGPLTILTWKEISPFLAQYIDSVSGIIVVLYLIIYMAVAILILNAMLMAVFERIREFGVLKAIGYGPFQVLGMMLAEGMMLAVVATVLGLLCAAPGMWYMTVYGINVGTLGGMEMAGMTMPPIWHGVYTVKTCATPIAMLFIISFFAVLYPAIKAAWIRPVEAMHHQ